MQATIELQDQIEQRRQISQMGPQIHPQAMEEMFQAANSAQHREDRLHDPALVPSSLGTNFEGGRHPLFANKSLISQDDRFPRERFKQGQKGLVRDIGCAPLPGHDLAAIVEQPTQFHSDNPAAVSGNAGARCDSSFSQ